MKLRFTCAVLIVLVISFLPVAVVEAQWSALNSGYAITSNYHGIDVLPGTSVTVKAGTTEYPNVISVEFRWMPPAESGLSEWVDGPFPMVDSGELWDGKPIYIATDTQTINAVGDWGVQAWFYNSWGKKRGPDNLIEAIRATSFNVVPEVPWGTISVSAAMIAALGVFALKKKRTVGIKLKL